jgi:FtsP/CotA-like multicopper oxidase with cupredoxin domain
MNETTIQTTPASRREGTVMAIKNNKKRVAAAVIAIAGLAGGAVAVHAATFADVTTGAAAPASMASIAPTCTTDCAIALDAGTGSITVQDAINGPQIIPFEGFGVNGAPASLAGSPNSTIKVPQGTTLTINLSQTAGGDPIDLSFPSLPASDVSAVGNVYTVHASKVGTSVFQPGSNADAPKQVAMGLVGVLIVTPTGCSSPTLSCAYDGTSYDDEALVATTDLDYQFATNSPDFPGMGYFGQSAMPDGSQRKVYHVINGKSFPDTDVIDVRAGESVLLRSVNAGVTDKSMSLLGLHQTLLARNTAQYTDPQTLTAPLVGPGETADLSVQIPADAASNQRYALIDAGRQMNSGTSYGFGGALTFFNVWPPAPVVPPVVVLPVVNSATFTAPDQLAISGTSTTGNITGAEVSIGAAPAAAGTGSPVGSAFGSPTYSETVTLVPAPVSGDTVWVRVQDSSGWSNAFSVAIP